MPWVGGGQRKPLGGGSAIVCQRYRVCSPASLVWLFGECVEVDEVISAGGVCVASSVWCPLRWLNLLVRALRVLRVGKNAILVICFLCVRPAVMASVVMM